MGLNFHKLVGAGNDFIFIEQNRTTENITNKTQLIKDLCDRKWGVGADGVVFLKKKESDENFFSWEFYNKDGQTAEMCGNAARCAVLYFKEFYNLSDCRIETSIGIVKGKYREGKLQVSWDLKNKNSLKKTVFLKQLPSQRLKEKEPPSLSENSNKKTKEVPPFPLSQRARGKSFGKNIEGEFVDTGVPHFVILVQGDFPDKEQCLLIQNSEEFLPHKTNVTLLKKDDDRGYQTKTFERGVEDFTLSCGTGVIACAIVLKKLSGGNNFILKTPGGVLEASVEEQTVGLSGPGQISFSGDFYV